MSNFRTGKLCFTCGVAEKAASNHAFGGFVKQALSRYITGDWGELSSGDKKQNDDAVAHGDARILAAYECPGQPSWRIWIITEADRSVTTILFPDEY